MGTLRRLNRAGSIRRRPADAGADACLVDRVRLTAMGNKGVGMPVVPVLLTTHDDSLWQLWRQLHPGEWLPARGDGLADLSRWRERGHRIVVLDADAPRLPPWTDSVWAEHFSHLRIIVASRQPNDGEGKGVLAAGASGYIPAHLPAHKLTTVLQTVNAGNVWLGPSLLSRLLRQIDAAVPGNDGWTRGLTLREQEVARRAAMGECNQAIADALCITERTVRAHLSSAFVKLGVSDRLSLALRVHGVRVPATPSAPPARWLRNVRSPLPVRAEEGCDI